MATPRRSDLLCGASGSDLRAASRILEWRPSNCGSASRTRLVVRLAATVAQDPPRLVSQRGRRAGFVCRPTMTTTNKRLECFSFSDRAPFIASHPRAAHRVSAPQYGGHAHADEQETQRNATPRDEKRKHHRHGACANPTPDFRIFFSFYPRVRVLALPRVARIIKRTGRRQVSLMTDTRT